MCAVLSCCWGGLSCAFRLVAALFVGLVGFVVWFVDWLVLVWLGDCCLDFGFSVGVLRFWC